MLQPPRPSGSLFGPWCVTLLMGTCLLPGCSKSEDAVAEAATTQMTGKEAGVQRKGEMVTVQAGDAEIKVSASGDGTSGGGTSVALPAGFPGDVFLPSQRVVNSAMDMAGLKMVNITTAAPPAAVAADIGKAMQAQGWTREMAMQADGGSTLVYTKDQRQAVYQMVSTDDGGTQVAVRAGSE